MQLNLSLSLVGRGTYLILYQGVMLMRINILLEAAETGERIYLTSKNRRNTPDRLELKKYSPKLRRVTTFKEVK
ncbi:50S ribosomal protein L33 [Weissella soli]|nr:50S ribosomal protein L33 [Weissella soli]